MKRSTEDSDLQSTVSLLDEAKQGNEEAKELLYRRYLSPLRRWARGRLPQWARDLSDTDDLVQDTFKGTLKRLDEFDYLRTGAFLSYLRKAVLNRVNGEIRRVRRRPPGR